MGTQHRADVSRSVDTVATGSPMVDRLIVPGVDVVRAGRAERFLDTSPTRSGATVQWEGIALDSLKDQTDKLLRTHKASSPLFVSIRSRFNCNDFFK